ncbi:MAG: SIMPL domain-containing protein [Ignavibacteria bacterium]|nr:SIMPL domain-containing protein [Ignavibacteria bacterium]
MFKENKFIIPSVIISIFLVIVALIISAAWRNHTRSSQTITVTGSAKKEIISDLAILRGTISSEAPNAQTAYRMLINQKPALLEYFSKQGFPKDKITFQTITSYPVYEVTSTGVQTNTVRGYVYSQRMELISNDVNKIREISLDISSLIEKGVNFSVEMPEYHYTKLGDLKIETQAEAAKDAMTRAVKIAEATNSSLGNMRSARMGVLQITPKFSNMVSDYGVNDLSSIEKEITAVVNASFEIR